MSLRGTMQKDLAKLIGSLPVMCGWSVDAQTIPCAWRSQRDEIRFSAIGVLGETPSEIIVDQVALGRKPVPQEVLFVAGHRYRVTDVSAIDSVSYVITLDRSDH